MIVWILTIAINIGSIKSEEEFASYPNQESCMLAGKYWTSDPSGGQLEGVKFTCTQRTKT